MALPGADTTGCGAWDLCNYRKFWIENATGVLRLDFPGNTKKTSLSEK